MKKYFNSAFLLFCLTVSHATRTAEQAMQDLRAVIAQTTYSTNDAQQEQLYLDYVRILLDPAYLDMTVAERKTIDAINEKFKQLHTQIGNTFIPILPQESIEQLKQIAAEAVKTINSTKIKKIGGEIFKKRVQFMIASLMAISANQTATENEIKFQWVKPLYMDNQFLTPDLKKKMFEMFNNGNYQKWLTSTKKFTLKVAPSQGIIAPEPFTTEPIAPITTSSEQSVETLTLSDSAQQRLNQAQQRKLPAIPNTPPAQAPVPTVTPTSTPTPRDRITPQNTVATGISSDLQKIGAMLIQQSLVAPIATIRTTIAKVPADQKFSLLRVTDDAQYTAVHAAASLARADVISMLLKDLTPHQKFEIITMREKDGQTSLHLAASAKSAPAKGFKPAIAIEELLKGCTPEQKKEVINIRDNDGATAIDIAQGINKGVVDILKRNA